VDSLWGREFIRLEQRHRKCKYMRVYIYILRAVYGPVPISADFMAENSCRLYLAGGYVHLRPTHQSVVPSDFQIPIRCP